MGRSFSKGGLINFLVGKKKVWKILDIQRKQRSEVSGH